MTKAQDKAEIRRALNITFKDYLFATSMSVWFAVIVSLICLSVLMLTPFYQELFGSAVKAESVTLKEITEVFLPIILFMVVYGSVASQIDKKVKKTEAWASTHFKFEHYKTFQKYLDIMYIGWPYWPGNATDLPFRFNALIVGFANSVKYCQKDGKDDFTIPFRATTQKLHALLREVDWAKHLEIRDYYR